MIIVHYPAPFELLCPSSLIHSKKLKTNTRIVTGTSRSRIVL